MSVEESLHRSVRRHIGRALEADADSELWQVVLEERAIPIETRPVAVVHMIAPVTPERYTRRSIPQGIILRNTTFVTTLYPAPGDTARASTWRARRLASLLQDSVEIGLSDEEAGEALSYPFQLPVYDWDTLPEEDREVLPGPETPWQWATVMDVSTQVIPDPADDRLYTVVLTTRLRYQRPGRIRTHGEAALPFAESMPVSPDFS